MQTCTVTYFAKNVQAIFSCM